MGYEHVPCKLVRVFNARPLNASRICNRTKSLGYATVLRVIPIRQDRLTILLNYY